MKDKELHPCLVRCSILNITISGFAEAGSFGMIILSCNTYDVKCMSITNINMKLKCSSVKFYEERLQEIEGFN